MRGRPGACSIRRTSARDRGAAGLRAGRLRPADEAQAGASSSSWPTSSSTADDRAPSAFDEFVAEHPEVASLRLLPGGRRAPRPGLADPGRRRLERGREDAGHRPTGLSLSPLCPVAGRRAAPGPGRRRPATRAWPGISTSRSASTSTASTSGATATPSPPAPASAARPTRSSPRGRTGASRPSTPTASASRAIAYLIASFRNHLRYANALRIDHVMGLHRLFWIPNGAEAKDGAFVSTPAEEIYAILSRRVAPPLRLARRRGPRDRPARGRRGDEAAQRPGDVRRPVRGPARPGPAAPRGRPRRPSPASTPTTCPPSPRSGGASTSTIARTSASSTPNGSRPRRMVRDEQRRAVVEFLQAEGMLEPTPRPTTPGRSSGPPGTGWPPRRRASCSLNLEDLWLETESQNTPNTYLRAAQLAAEAPPGLRAVRRRPGRPPDLRASTSSGLRSRPGPRHDHSQYGG